LEKEKFICQICQKEYPTLSHLSKHINTHNISKKEYYDNYLKKKGDGVCPICHSSTPYTNKWQNAYKIYCSNECKKAGVPKNVERTSIERYGVSNVNKLKDIRNKIKITNEEIYGNSCPMQNLEIQRNIRRKNLERLGVELPFQSKKIQKKGAITRKEKYGGEYTFQSSELVEKIHKTNMLRYGMPNPIQSLGVFSKQQLSGLFIKRYKESSLFYQGSYELDFLEKYYDLLNIQRAPFIKYKFRDKERIYYPDFYIPSINLIIEVKNKYLAKRDKQTIRAKKKAVIQQGFQFIMIVNKNYEEFEKLISSSSL